MFRMFARAMMSVIKEYKSGGAFLDIGCSVGYLLDEARLAGFDSTRGIELNLDSAAITRTKGHVVYTEPMEKVPLEEGMFDVISFNHVLEHILSFKPFLAAVRKTLKADGVIYCGMPNYKGLMQGWLREKWYGWGMPDHVWHFEPATLEAVMGENGFIAKQITQNAMYYPYSRSLRKNTRAAVARIAGGLGLGDQVFGIFEKAPGG